MAVIFPFSAKPSSEKSPSVSLFLKGGKRRKWELKRVHGKGVTRRRNLVSYQGRTPNLLSCPPPTRAFEGKLQQESMVT